jgi:uncharacterized protein with PIN domain
MNRSVDELVVDTSALMAMLLEEPDAEQMLEIAGRAV